MKKPLFVVTRHGSTAGNEQDRYRGWSQQSFAQLSAEGRNDIHEAGEFIKTMGVEFPLILSDDLDRSEESQEILAKVLGIKELQTDKRLRPLDVGDYTGLSKEKYPLDEYLKHKNKKIPGGESMNEFNRRLAKVFADILELVAKIKKPILIIGHGSTISFLHDAVSDKPSVGYEGLVHPGGVIAFTKNSVDVLFKEKTEGKGKPDNNKTQLVQLSKWSIEFVGGKETNNQPKACQNCHLMYKGQKTCSILGPDIIIDVIRKDGQIYTPVCGEHDAGTPMSVSDAEAKYDLNALIGPEKADSVGLEWAEGKGTNCGGANDGAPCKYFESEDGKDGICLVLKSNPDPKESKVDWDDCCAAHDGPSMPWRDAQKLLKE